MTDEEHLSRCAAGLFDSFDFLVERYQAHAINFAHRFLGDRGNSEDLAQEAFLRVYRDSAKFAPGTSFRAWFFTILTNLCRDARKKGTPAYCDVVPEQPDCRPGPGDSWDRTMKIRAVRTALQKLPENQRLAVLLAVYEQLSHKEIGTSLGISAKAVESLLSRARGSLRSDLEQYF